MPGAARVGDMARNPADGHGCLACPHPVVGPIISGSGNVFVNGRPSARIQDPGIHAACCDGNNFKIAAGSGTVFVNGKKMARKNDKTSHCGGSGQIIQGSSDVITGG